MEKTPKILVIIWEGRRHEFDMNNRIDVRLFAEISKAIVSGQS